MNKKEKAHQVLRRYAKKVNDSAEDFLNIAYTYVDIGDFENAVIYADKAIRAGKNNILINKGYLQLWLKDLRISKEEVDNRYLERFQNTLKSFNERFPEDDSFKEIKVKLDDPDDIVNKLLEQLPSEDWKEQTRDLFTQRQYPVSLLSSFTGRDVYTTWLNIVENDQYGIFNNSGNENELSLEKGIIKKAGEILIDPISLFTLDKLGLLGHLSDYFNSILVPQRVLDVLSSAKSDQMGLLESGGMTLYAENEKIVRQDIPKSYLETILSDLDRIIDFISNPKKVNIIGKSVGRDEKIDNHVIDEVLNKDDIIIKECFLEARHREIPLFVEDLFYKNTAIHDFSIESFGSLAFIEVLKEKDLIKENEYHDILLDLIKSGYHFTIMSAPTFCRLIEKNFVINNDVLKTIDAFKRQNHNVEKLIGFTFHVIKWIWGNVSDKRLREQWTFLVLNLIPKSVSRKEIHDFFKVKAEKMFHRFDLIKKEDFKQLIDDWFSSGSIIYL